jgi:exosortase/archaeosortase family protein
MNHLKDILISSLSRLKGIILFLVISTIVIGGWKLVHLDDYLVVWIAGFFNQLIFVEIHLAQFFIREVMGFQSNLTGDVITMPNTSALLMNPGCTGFKQVIQLCIIMLIYPGPIRKKAWYIPIASFVLFLSSILHFVMLAVLLDKFPLQFAFFHDHLSRWIYFTIFFLAWLVWEDYLRSPKIKKI